MKSEERNPQSMSTPNASVGAPSRAKVPGTPRQSLGSAIRNACLSALLGFAAVFLVGHAVAQLPTPATAPATPELEARLKKLETELRCLVCQNQTLAESPAGLAGDLRREIRLLADQGKNNDEIKAHLKARYGDFVLYKPEVQPKTWLLWAGPFALLAGGALIFVLMNRRRPAASAGGTMPDAEVARAKQLLEGKND